MNPERDTKLRELAYDVGVALANQPLDIGVGAATLWMVTQVDIADDPAFTAYVIGKLRQVADVIEKIEQEKGE